MVDRDQGRSNIIKNLLIRLHSWPRLKLRPNRNSSRRGDLTSAAEGRHSDLLVCLRTEPIGVHKRIDGCVSRLDSNASTRGKGELSDGYRGIVACVGDGCESFAKRQNLNFRPVRREFGQVA